MTTQKHWQLCEAPICMDERCYVDQPNWKKEVLWYPGELFCKKRPWTKFQKRQNQINKWMAKGLLKWTDRYFTVESLLSRSKLMRGIKGGDPEAKTWTKPSQHAKLAPEVPFYKGSQHLTSQNHMNVPLSLRTNVLFKLQAPEKGYMTAPSQT